MADEIAKRSMTEITPLRTSDPVGSATKRVIDLGLPALPVVDEKGKFAGIYGEREFMAAFFPGYMNDLHSAAVIKRTMDETIDRRIGCSEEPIGKYLTTDHVVVEDDYSDTQLAELFLHHRVLVIPIATEGKIHAVVKRSDFFHAMASRVVSSLDDFGD